MFPWQHVYQPDPAPIVDPEKCNGPDGASCGWALPKKALTETVIQCYYCPNLWKWNGECWERFGK